MKFGALTFTNATETAHVLAPVVAQALLREDSSDVFAAAIDDTLSDTAAFCAAYDIGMDQGANCVIVQAKRADKVWYAACVVRGADKIDINGVVRKQLGAKKVSFAAMSDATQLSGMEYGGITPVGLPADWPILVDEAVVATDRLIIGSGVRGSKLLVSGQFLAALPNVAVLALTK